jgi:hypothetical protein
MTNRIFPPVNTLDVKFSCRIPLSAISTRRVCSSPSSSRRTWPCAGRYRFDNGKRWRLWSRAGSAQTGECGRASFDRRCRLKSRGPVFPHPIAGCMPAGPVTWRQTLQRVLSGAPHRSRTPECRCRTHWYSKGPDRDDVGPDSDLHRLQLVQGLRH